MGKTAVKNGTKSVYLQGVQEQNFQIKSEGNRTQWMCYSYGGANRFVSACFDNKHMLMWWAFMSISWG